MCNERISRFLLLVRNRLAEPISSSANAAQTHPKILKIHLPIIRWKPILRSTNLSILLEDKTMPCKKFEQFGFYRWAPLMVYNSWCQEFYKFSHERIQIFRPWQFQVSTNGKILFGLMGSCEISWKLGPLVGNTSLKIHVHGRKALTSYNQPQKGEKRSKNVGELLNWVMASSSCLSCSRAKPPDLPVMTLVGPHVYVGGPHQASTTNTRPVYCYCVSCPHVTFFLFL